MDFILPRKELCSQLLSIYTTVAMAGLQQKNAMLSFPKEIKSTKATARLPAAVSWTEHAFLVPLSSKYSRDGGHSALALTS